MATEQASRLQSLRGMKSSTVAMLAALFLAGCGVGVDDPEGQQAAAGYGVMAQGLMSTGSSNDFGTTGTPTLQKLGSGTVSAVDGTRALPQDPVPILPTGTRPDSNTTTAPPPPVPPRS